MFTNGFRDWGQYPLPSPSAQHQSSHSEHVLLMFPLQHQSLTPTERDSHSPKVGWASTPATHGLPISGSPGTVIYGLPVCHVLTECHIVGLLQALSLLSLDSCASTRSRRRRRRSPSAAWAAPRASCDLRNRRRCSLAASNCNRFIRRCQQELGFVPQGDSGGWQSTHLMLRGNLLLLSQRHHSQFGSSGPTRHLERNGSRRDRLGSD